MQRPISPNIFLARPFPLFTRAAPIRCGVVSRFHFLTVAVCVGAWGLLGEFGAVAAGLRYEFQPGSNYVYAVRAVATEREAVESLAGLVTYSVKGMAGASMTLVSRAALRRERVTAQDLLLPLADAAEVNALRVGGFRLLETGAAGSSGEFQIDAQGRAFRGAIGTAMFGEVTRLIVDPLLPAGKSAWSVKADCELVFEDILSNPRATAPPRMREVRVPAREQVLYSLADVGEESVVLKREYELRTGTTGAGGRQVVLAGEGTNTFDLARGLPLTMNFQGALTETIEGGGTRRTPVIIEYRLLEGAELAAAIKVGRAAGKGDLKRLTTTEHAALLVDVRGVDRLKQRLAVQRLAGFQPAGNRAEIARVLVALASDNDVSMRAAAVKALGVWGTAAEERVFARALEDRELTVRQVAIEALAGRRTARAAETLAELVVLGRDFSQASAALRGMGATAEPAVLKLLEHPNLAARREACQLLKAIGTPQSLPALNAAARGADSVVALLAREAVKAVNGRSGAGKR